MTGTKGAAVRVKICGITRLEDALAAGAAGADAIGLVFADSSPRRVSTARAREIVAALPPFATAVGVFGRAPAARVREVAREAGLAVVQVHGEEAALELLSRPEGLVVIPAVRIGVAADSERLARFAGARAILCDSAARSDREGGTGVPFPWEWLEGVPRPAPLVLAGGLTPENVAAAVRRVRPYAVDVSTGVESAPGAKDRSRVAAFVAAAKGA